MAKGATSGLWSEASRPMRARVSTFSMDPFNPCWILDVMTANSTRLGSVGEELEEDERHAVSSIRVHISAVAKRTGARRESSER